MTMAIIPAQTGRISGIFWRRPALGLFLLLLGPLMWFGIVYLGSLLTLLWQSIYTFDDFTMSVTATSRWLTCGRCSTLPTTTLLCGPW